jgi:hypothetical protein
MDRHPLQVCEIVTSMSGLFGIPSAKDALWAASNMRQSISIGRLRIAGAALPPSHIPIKGNYYKSGPSQGDILHDELWKYKLVWYSGYIADFLIVTKGLGFKRGSSTFFICTK